MTLPGWTQQDDLHIRDGYRIEPAPRPPEGGWVVRVDDPRHPVMASIDEARFTSLKAAKSAAIHHQMLALKRTKMIRHAVVATLGLIIVIPTFATMWLAESAHHVVWFAIALAALLVALRELVHLSLLALSQGFDYAYEKPKVTGLDRLVADVAMALRSAPETASSLSSEAEPPVHVVDVPKAERRRS